MIGNDIINEAENDARALVEGTAAWPGHGSADHVRAVNLLAFVRKARADQQRAAEARPTAVLYGHPMTLAEFASGVRRMAAAGYLNDGMRIVAAEPDLAREDGFKRAMAHVADALDQFGKGAP